MRDFLACESGVVPAGPDSEGRFLCCAAGETPLEPADVSDAADRLCRRRDGQTDRQGRQSAGQARKTTQSRHTAAPLGPGLLNWCDKCNLKLIFTKNLML